jgi:protein phosphatase-4 regulatory subunit 3
MDESSLTTLGSLLTFTQADVVKGVIYAPDRPHNNSTKSSDSYLEQVLGLLGKEIMAIREVEWSCIYDTTHESLAPSSDNSAVHFMSQNEGSDSQDSSWQQHLIAQDNSLSSRKLRRRGCLSFLRELFNMVRNSLQQSDKENFYNLLVGLDVELNINATDTNDEIQTVTLLSLLGAILSDVNSDISEKGACLEILSIIAMFDASLIRKHCLVEFSSAEKDVDISKDGDRNMAFTTRPHPDDDDKVRSFICINITRLIKKLT